VAGEPSASPAAADLWHGRDRVLVASQKWNATTFALDAVCLFGGAWYVPRTEEMVLNGTARFNVTVEAGALYTGLEVGLQFHKDDILWLGPVANAKRSFEVKVLPEQWESGDEQAWTFWYRDTVDGSRELCYTGLSLGDRTITIEAVRA
jgi:hypothetical protein